jgi:hypothetical protein
MPRRPFLSCRQFRRLHTEFVDATLSHEAQASCRTHLESCPACAAHDVTIRRSLMALQVLRTIEPSPDFRSKLHARIARAEAAPPAPPQGGFRWGMMAGALLAASVALLAFVVPSGRTATPVRLTPVFARAPKAEVAPAPRAVTAPLRATVAANRSSARFEALPGQPPLRAPQESRPSTMRISTVNYIGQ